MFCKTFDGNAEVQKICSQPNSGDLQSIAGKTSAQSLAYPVNMGQTKSSRHTICFPFGRAVHEQTKYGRSRVTKVMCAIRDLE